MLVLSRRIGERVIAPLAQLTITVLAVEGNAVRLGITAPDDVAIYREEVWRRLGQPSHRPRLHKAGISEGGHP